MIVITDEMYQIEIPWQIVNDMDIDCGTVFKVEVSGNSIILKKVTRFNDDNLRKIIEEEYRKINKPILVVDANEVKIQIGSDIQVGNNIYGELVEQEAFHSYRKNKDSKYIIPLIGEDAEPTKYYVLAMRNATAFDKEGKKIGELDHPMNFVYCGTVAILTENKDEICSDSCWNSVCKIADFIGDEAYKEINE